MRSGPAALVRFFLKTYFFRPASNPIPAAIVVLLAFFHLEGGLDKSHIALALYVVVAGHLFMGNLFGGGGECRAIRGELPLLRYFRTLPVSARRVFSSYMLASALYIAAAALLLGFLLVRLMALPDWAGIEIVEQIDESGVPVTVVHGFEVSARGIHSPASMVLEKSLLFDTVRETGGAGRWLAGYMAAAFLYVSVFGVYRAFRPVRAREPASLLFRLPFAAYAALGALLLAEVVLSREAMWIALRFLAAHAGTAALLFLVVLAATVISLFGMTAVVWRELGARGR